MKNERVEDGRGSASIVDRVHELLAESVRTHPDVEARGALRAALIELEVLRERLHDESLRQ